MPARIKSKGWLFVCALSVLAGGCAAGISRTGYQMSDAKYQATTNCPVVIQFQAKYDPKSVSVLGTISAYDNGFSTECEEVVILDRFCREACSLGADLVNITEEKQPNFWTSSCYRAKAEFLVFHDRAKAANLVCDARYVSDKLNARSAAATKRNHQIMIGTIAGGLVGGAIVSAATAPGDGTNGPSHSATNAVSSPRGAH